MDTSKLPTTWEGISAIAGIDPIALPDVSGFPERLRKFITANFKVAIIAEVLNKVGSELQSDEQWKPDWNNYDQYKYSPWFEIEASEQVPSGFGFSRANCDIARTYSGVGSRLLFRSSELAMYAGETFADIYKDLILMD